MKSIAKSILDKLIRNKKIMRIALGFPILKYFFFIYLTRKTAAPIKFKSLFYQKILGINRKASWPVHYASIVTDADKIKIGIAVAPGIMPACYIQGANGIRIGDYTIIATGVGIVSANHSLYDYDVHEKCNPIRIGKYCWIGMNSVILPGVELGDHVIVAAGSIVNKSFKEGYCVIGGVPVRKLKDLDRNLVVEKRSSEPYIFRGYSFTINDEVEI